ncbi:MAG: hypothetical protein ACKO96_11880 [Flammeovirgaceae bacterium]
MDTVARVLTKVLVKKFYERNAGLLAFVFYAMFGVVESNQIVSYHLSLIHGVLSSTIFLLVVMIVWLLYSLKFLQLIFSELAQPQNQFLFLFSMSPRMVQYTSMLVALIAIYLPVLIYSFFIVAVGFTNQLPLPALAVIVFHVAVLIISARLVIGRLCTLHEKQSFALLPTLRLGWARPFSFFYISKLLNEIPLALLFTKLFSLFSIFGFLQIPLDHYENRVALLGFLFGLMGHTIIVFEFRKLEVERMTFLRGLPLPAVRHYAQLVLVYLLVILPEVIFLFINHLHAIDLVLTTFFGVAFLLYQHHRLYRFGLNMDKHTTHTFGLFLVSFMVVLFKLAWPGAMVLFVLAFVNLKRHYYSWEWA